MKKILLFGIIIFLFSFVGVRVGSTQMMGLPADATPANQSNQDDGAGKAIWDKLQNKQTSCRNLTDADFDKLGDFFMGSMMGSSHDAMDQIMTQRLGQQGEEQMHVAMGKRLSGCNTTAALPSGASYFMPMMGWGNMMGGAFPMTGYGGTYNNITGGWALVGAITWIAVMVFLVLGSVYFWKQITRKPGKN